jgi:hypothetical protein
VALTILRRMGWLALLASAAAAQDSLYAECDSTSREFRAGSDPQTGDAAAYDPGLPCEAAPEMERNAFDGGRERFSVCKQERLTLKHGGFESLYPGGIVRERGEYAHGRKTGEWREWYPDGKPKAVANYLQGRLEGIALAFHPNGKVMDEFKYRDGRIDCRDGYHRSYYRMGRLKVDLGIKAGRLVKYAFYDSLGKELALPVILNP